jgi:hypothetical protein
MAPKKVLGSCAFLLTFVIVLVAASTGQTSDDFSEYVNANDILMLVSNSGSLGCDVTDVFGHDYGTYYPYTTVADIQSGTNILSPLYAAGLWLGGKVGGETRVTVAEYGVEYTPGPMSGGTFMPDAHSNVAYRVYKLHADSGSTNPNTDYTEWPVGQGAPVDGLGDPLYWEDQTLWTVFNDADTALHQVPAGGTDPLGIEVHQTVWADDEPGGERVIYVKYKLYNKGGSSITDFYIGFWTDADLGGREDDYSGCDTVNDLFYNYNADDDDLTYGSAPPAIGVRLVHGPLVASVNDTAVFDGVEVSDHKNLRLSSVVSYINGTDPNSGAQSYNCLGGFLPTGDILPLGLKFSYPGDPVAGTGALDTNPTDKKVVGAAGPLTFNPGDSQFVMIKLAIGQGATNLASVTDMKALLTAPDNIITDVPGESQAVLPHGYALYQNYPNPFNPSTVIRFEIPVRANVDIRVLNLLGQRVRTLAAGVRAAGPHEVIWNGRDDRGDPVPSGVYLYRANLGSHIASRKMLLLK